MYVWHCELGLGLDSDLGTQEFIWLVFARFRKLGSARQAHLRLHEKGAHFPRPLDGKSTVHFEWTRIRYRNVVGLLKNPFYAGVYAYGRSERRTAIVDGRIRRSYGRSRPFGKWEVMLTDHHEG